MAGGKDAVPVTRALWVDLDTSAARGRLARFKPVPSMIVHSGGGAHAYWELREPAAADAAEPVLRRLAMALEADRACAEVARVLRPPGSFNHKTRPARPARLIGMTGARYSLDELAAGTLSNNPYIETVGKGRAADSQAGQTLSNNPHIETIRKGPGRPDPLRMIPALEYVPALTGRHPGRDGKLECPFHPDEHPSFHAYPGADDWFCFQCERGGDIYTLAAGLTGLDHRTQFRALRQCLLERFRAVA
jgi:hypothetical protein